jgi:hypothetical protein
MSLSREELLERYGQPARLPDDLDGKILVFGHDSEEAALAYVDANIEHYDHEAWMENRDGQWVSVVDLRPRIAQIEQELRDERFYDKSS